jgi:hypothetical protein
MVGLVAPRSIDKRLKKTKKQGVQALLLLPMVESKAPTPLLAMVGPIMPISIKRQNKTKNKKKGNPSSLAHLCPKTQKRKEKKKNGFMFILE